MEDKILAVFYAYDQYDVENHAKVNSYIYVLDEIKNMVRSDYKYTEGKYTKETILYIEDLYKRICGLLIDNNIGE